MTDTQWPRYEVFVQERADRPHIHAGSVHAPDPEMAILNARDVFVRRPDCTSLWVVPASAVFSRTEQELQAGAQAPAEPGVADTGSRVSGPAGPYAVFGKLDQKGTMVHLGEVEADGRDEAMAAARGRFEARRPLALWVVSDRSLRRSDAADAASLFEPARHKPFRDQAFYRIQTALRRLRSASTDPPTRE